MTLSNVRTTKYGMNVVHELASGIRDTVEHMYDQIWNIFETLASVGLAPIKIQTVSVTKRSHRVLPPNQDVVLHTIIPHVSDLLH